MGSTGCEVSWFAALCDDDYEFLGVPPALRSSWEHCRTIALAAEEAGYDNLLLPSGYAMGIDSVAFAAGIAPLLRRMQLLLAVRMGEMWPPQLARQLATIDQMLGGRLTINIISSALPGQDLDAEPRYRRTLEILGVLRDLLNGKPVDFHGEFVSLTLEPPRLAGRRVPAVLLRRPVRGGTGGGRAGRGRVPDVAGHHGGCRGGARRHAVPGRPLRARAAVRLPGARDRAGHRAGGQGRGPAAAVPARPGHRPADPPPVAGHHVDRQRAAERAAGHRR